MTTFYDKAKTILTGLIEHVENTGNLKNSVHVFNIAVALDDQNPQSKIDRAVKALFDIVDYKKNDDIKLVKQYLKTVTLTEV